MLRATIDCISKLLPIIIMAASGQRKLLLSLARARALANADSIRHKTALITGMLINPIAYVTHAYRTLSLPLTLSLSVFLLAICQPLSALAFGKLSATYELCNKYAVAVAALSMLWLPFMRFGWKCGCLLDWLVKSLASEMFPCAPHNHALHAAKWPGCQP